MDNSLLLTDSYYHIYNHANGDDNLFREEKNYYYFLEKYHHHIDPVAETVAWCLMPNHFHLLVKIKDASSLLQTFPKFGTLEKLKNDDKLLSNLLSKKFANFFSSYTQSFNKVYKRRGSLFLKNFKRKPVETEDYIIQLILYIHLNPVKHGFTDDILNWQWSSKDDFWKMVPDLAMDLFGNRDLYEELHQKKQREFADYYLIENDILNAKP